jgi:hypothetical protein
MVFAQRLVLREMARMVQRFSLLDGGLSKQDAVRWVNFTMIVEAGHG